MLLLFILSISPFNEANFVALPYRSVSVLSNPAGIGKSPGAEAFLAYRSDSVTCGITIGNIGGGFLRVDSNMIYEISTGFKLPGVFSIGYARQFGDSSENIFGLECDMSQYFVLGYKTTLGRKKYMNAGAGLMMLGSALIVTGEMNYEGIDDYNDYRFGFLFAPTKGVTLNFVSDLDWHWHSGVVLAGPRIKLAFLYSHKVANKFSVGLLLSAQSYQ